MRKNIKKISIIVLGLLGLLGVALWFYVLISARSGIETRYYSQIVTAALSLATFLLLIVFTQIFRLWRDYRRRIFGARIKFRLMLMFGIISIIPGLIIYAVSVQFVTRSIESWFNLPLEKGLEASLALGRSGLEFSSIELRQRAMQLLEREEIKPVINALYLPTERQQAMNNLSKLLHVKNLSLFDHEGKLLFSDVGQLTNIDSLPPKQLKEVLTQRESQYFDDTSDQNFTAHSLLRISGDLEAHPLILQLDQTLPPNLNSAAEAVTKTYRSYQELNLARQGLTRLYATGLTLTIIMVLTGALSAAFALSQRLIAPLYVLAEGTRAVAQGDFTPREVVSGKDELGLLTHSFNEMTRQLEEARQETERHRLASEDARIYLESILTNLSTGVLVFDEQLKLRMLNDAAISVLGDNLGFLVDTALTDWDAYPELIELLTRQFAGQQVQDWGEQLSIMTPMNSLTLMVRGSSLPAGLLGHSPGYIVVFDDISNVIKAQRSAAWGEVARRLAHEIKNPLMPIQLSAERLEYRLAEKLSEDDQKMLSRSTRTIISQVQAMKRMVDEFRDYARMPAPQLAPLNLNELIQDVSTLYENSGILITLNLAVIPPVQGDVSLLRQVIHNLLTNAQEALVDVANPMLVIETLLDNYHVILKVGDNGCGFPEKLREQAFEPYFTTKEKGTGLGLAIVKKIIDEHHGTIEIQRGTPPVMTVMLLRLPVAT